MFVVRRVVRGLVHEHQIEGQVGEDTYRLRAEGLGFRVFGLGF